MLAMIWFIYIWMNAYIDQQLINVVVINFIDIIKNIIIIIIRIPGP